MQPARWHCPGRLTLRPWRHGHQQSDTRRGSGFTSNGLPYNRLADGPRTAVAFSGLNLIESKPLTGMEARFMLAFYEPLLPECAVYLLGRKKGLPDGYTMADMSDDYTATIAHELAGPVDVIGMSTGGSRALQSAADHGDLVRRLVIHSAAYRLGPVGKEGQLRVRDLVRDRKWREASAEMVRLVLGPRWYGGLVVPAAAMMMARSAPDDPTDLVATIEADDAFDLHDRLSDITAPTLVIAGAADPFYTEELFRETARGVPGAKLVLYAGMGHPARGAEFKRELRAFVLRPSDQ